MEAIWEETGGSFIEKGSGIHLRRVVEIGKKRLCRFLYPPVCDVTKYILEGNGKDLDM